MSPKSAPATASQARPALGTRPSLPALGRSVRQVAGRAADAYEDAPWSVHRLASAAMTHANRRADARCAADPQWAAIEARRRNPDGTRTLMSEKLSLGRDKMNLQRDIRDRVAPLPLWYELARALRERPVRRLRRQVRFVRQRVTRGWADSDTWSLDHHLCRTLAAQLDHLADNAHGWPGGERYPAYTDWQDALRTAAAGLRGWATREDSPASEAFGQALTGTATQAERDAAMRAAADDERDRLAAAQDALRWVAENLPSLWD